MPLKVTCDDCSKTYRVPESAAGKRIKCKECGSVLKIEAPQDDLADFDEDNPYSDDSSQDSEDEDRFEFPRRGAKCDKSKSLGRQSSKTKSRRSSPKSIGQSHVPLGISCIYFAFLGWVLIIACSFGIGLLARTNPILYRTLVNVIFFPALLVSIVTTIGKVLCLTTPRRMSGKPYIFIAATIDIIGLSMVLAAQFMYLSPELIGAVNLLSVFSMVCFVLFLRHLGHFLRNDEIVEKASGVLSLGVTTIVTWLIIIVIGLVGIRNASFQGRGEPIIFAMIVMGLLGLSLLIIGAIAVIRYAFLLAACYSALDERD